MGQIGAQIWGHGFYGFLPGKLYPIQIHVSHPCNAQGFMGRLREIVPLAALVAVTFRKTSDTKTSSNKNHQNSPRIIKQSPKKQPKRNNPTKNNLERIPDEVMQLQGSLPRPAQALKAQGAGRLGRSQLLC